jgi:uncharacterized membrane protein HdeD (DUF308 family)
LTALALLFAGYALIDGVLSLLAASGERRARIAGFMLVLEGIAGIVVAVIYGCMAGYHGSGAVFSGGCMGHDDWGVRDLGSYTFAAVSGE